MKCIALFYLHFCQFLFCYLFFLHTQWFFFWRVNIFWKSIFSVFSCQLLARSWSEANATRQNFKTNWQCEFSKLVHWVWKASERQSLSLLLVLVLPQSQLTQAALRVLLRSLEFALSWPANSGKFCLALFGKFSWRAFAAGNLWRIYEGVEEWGGRLWLCYHGRHVRDASLSTCYVPVGLSGPLWPLFSVCFMNELYTKRAK